MAYALFTYVVECTTVSTSAPTNCKNFSKNAWLEELAEKWPIIFKDCSMLGDTYNAQKMYISHVPGLSSTCMQVVTFEPEASSYKLTEVLR